MTATQYKKIALDWQPDAANTKGFYRILGIVLLSAVILAIVITFIKVPPENKRQRADVPDRVADFIARKEKPKPPPVPEKKLPPPPPKPVEPPPVEKNEVVQEITKQRDHERKPLTESEVRARKVAEKSGLLALANELNDLIDTKDVSAGLSKNLSNNGSGAGDANVIAGHNSDSLSAAQSGGKVDAQSYAGSVAKTDIDARVIGKDFTEHKEKAVAKAAAVKAQGGGSAEENVTIVFDRNKGSLYSLYERERRNTQGLQGKIVLQITISPAGDVVDVKIISSELNSPELESRILSRVKTFKFNINATKDTVVTYPIEFLPT
jgi:TonB family protein